MIKQPLIDRFKSKMSKPNNNGCILWNGAKRIGYGCITICNKGKYKLHSAHRISYELFIGKITKNKIVCHKCDNKLCVNPNHLFIGTHKQNTQDMINKKRHSYGEKQGSSKLKTKEVIKIKKMLKKGIYQRIIAEKFNVCKSTIYTIKNNINWKHITLEDK